MTREQLLNRKPLTRDVEVDGLGTVHVRKLTQLEVEKCRRDYAGNEEKTVAGLRYVVMRCVVDDEGKRIFNDNEMDKVGELDFVQVRTLAEAITDFSGLKPDPKAESVDSAATSTAD